MTIEVKLKVRPTPVQLCKYTDVAVVDISLSFDLLNKTALLRESLFSVLLTSAETLAHFSLTKEYSYIGCIRPTTALLHPCFGVTYKYIIMSYFYCFD